MLPAMSNKNSRKRAPAKKRSKRVFVTKAKVRTAASQYKKGAALKGLAAALGIGQSRMSSLLKAAGVKVRARGRPKGSKNKKKAHKEYFGG